LLGHEVYVANARQIPWITRSQKKTDRRDAEALARQVRVDPETLGPIQHRTAEQQADLSVLRARNGLVRRRSGLVSMVRGILKSYDGGRVVSGSVRNFTERAAEVLPEALAPAVRPVLQAIDALSAAIKEHDARIEALGATKYPETARLFQVSGVGPVTALGYAIVVMSHTFKKSRNVGPYLGLTPGTKDSGVAKPELPISKAGDGLMRRLLVGSAQYILGPFGPESDLRTFGLRLAAKGGKKGAKKRAAVAVARKLAVLLHRLGTTGETYEPLRSEPPKRRGGGRQRMALRREPSSAGPVVS
jgi:transposase